MAAQMYSIGNELWTARRVTLRSVSEPDPTLPFLTRLWFAWACFFRVLFDPVFAARAWSARTAPALPPAPAAGSALAAGPTSTRSPPVDIDAAPKSFRNVSKASEKALPGQPIDPALQLLALLQRDGRFIDFLEQEITSFPDVEIGAVARVVHEGCRKALHAHATITPIRSEEEGATVTLPEGFSPALVKLSGNVQGSAPYKGVVRHRGWRAADLVLPTPVKGHDSTIIAPAEVEL